MQTNIYSLPGPRLKRSSAASCSLGARSPLLLLGFIFILYVISYFLYFHFAINLAEGAGGGQARLLIAPNITPTFIIYYLLYSLTNIYYICTYIEKNMY